MDPSRFHSDQYHWIYQTGMEQLQQSSHPQATQSATFCRCACNAVVTLNV